MLNNKKDTLVYKFYNKDNELLYIGITNNFKSRYYQHNADKEWIDEVEDIYTSELMTRNMAHIYEIYYIANLKPKYNVDFADGGIVNVVLAEVDFTKSKYMDIRSRKVGMSQDEINEKIFKFREYLHSLTNSKLFSTEQEKLTSMIVNELPNIGNKIDYRTKKIKPSTLEKILNEDLGLKYVVVCKREGAYNQGNMGKKYLILIESH